MTTQPTTTTAPPEPLALLREKNDALMRLRMPLFMDTLVERFGVPMPARYVEGLTGSMEPRNCYANSYRLASQSSDYHYCEGFAVSSRLGLLIEHAWVIDNDGNAIDPTWHHQSSEVKYFGVPLAVSEQAPFLLAAKVYGILPNSFLWQRDLPCDGTPGHFHTLAQTIRTSMSQFFSSEVRSPVRSAMQSVCGHLSVTAIVPQSVPLDMCLQYLQRMVCADDYSVRHSASPETKGAIVEATGPVPEQLCERLSAAMSIKCEAFAKDQDH